MILFHNLFFVPLVDSTQNQSIRKIIVEVRRNDRDTGVTGRASQTDPLNPVLDLEF